MQFIIALRAKFQLIEILFSGLSILQGKISLHLVTAPGKPVAVVALASGKVRVFVFAGMKAATMKPLVNLLFRHFAVLLLVF